ncbi:MAG: YbdK family carboxylate-amine ligase [Actinomycetota bacterium]|nr:YbdK family carboxylate-amine ligase [Actinomycetota bacterium]MDQ4025481.1 YbdK family carboxylate-amine ligase [Actinomycetota bacterium]
MGEAQRLSPDEQLRLAREQFEQTQDLTVAVEEEFALLDPTTLGLVNRFEEVFAASAGTELEGSIVGELIASEVEIRTGRCETFPEAAQRMGERRAQLLALTDSLGVALAGTGTHPWSPWQEQRIIDTPHYRRNDEILRYVVWRNNSFGLHVHTGIRGPDRAIRVASALRNHLPELLAFSASSPFVESVYTHLHSARTEIFTRMFPRCGIPDAFESWAEYERYVRFLYESGSITEHTQIWWSVRPHLAFPTVELRICDGQPQLAEAQGLAALLYAVTARIARALDEGEALPSHPNHLLEENFWRAIRYGMSGELLDLSVFPAVRVRSARAALEELIEWTLPVAEELGAAAFLTVAATNPAERQIARYESGETLEAIYANEVLEPARV